MATFAEIQTRVQRRVIDLPTAVSTEVPTLINEAIRELEKKHNFKVMETLGGAYNTTESSRTLTTKPSDFKEYRGNPYFLENIGGNIDISLVANRNAVQDYYGNNDIGFPMFLLESEPTDTGTANWEVWPLPDSNSDYSDGEYRIYVPYWRFLPDLSDDTDTNWFTVNADEWIILRATAEAFAIDWDVDREVVWLKKAAIKYKEIINTDKRYRLSSVKTLVPLWQGVYQPNVRI